MFNEEAQRLLDDVECRRIVDDRDLAEVRRLRYDGYLREGAIAPDATRSVGDDFDLQENHWVFGVYLDGRLASTIRLGIASAADPRVPATKFFPDILEPFLEGGERILDPTRFVLDANVSAKHPKLAYVTLRMVWVLGEHMGVDRTLASVRTEHQAFYRRFFGCSQMCPARPYPPLVKPLSLMSVPTHEAVRGYLKYPFLRSSREEFDRLLGATEDVAASRRTRGEQRVLESA